LRFHIGDVQYFSVLQPHTGTLALGGALFLIFIVVTVFLCGSTSPPAKKVQKSANQKWCVLWQQPQHWQGM
jgi:hypothetical protein